MAAAFVHCCFVYFLKMVEETQVDGKKKLTWREKVEQAAKQSGKKSSALSKYQQRATYFWCLATLGLGAYAVSKYSYFTRFDRGISDFAYVCAISAFIIGIGFAALGYNSAKSAEKRGLAMVLLLVDIVATITYALHFFRLTPSLKDANGYPVDIGRFIEWLTCCPSLIALIGNVTRNTSIVDRTMTFDYYVVIAGFLSAVLKQPWSEGFLILSCFSHMVVVTGLYDMFTDAIEGKTGCTLDKTALKLSRLACMVSWNSFPIIFGLVRYKYVSFDEGECLYVGVDIIAKVFLTLILINASVDESQNQKVDLLSGIAADMEIEMGNTEKLLERMMPQEVIQQIKSGKSTEAQEYECVTVFFSDIANFTVLSGKTSVRMFINNIRQKICWPLLTSFGLNTTPSLKSGESTRWKLLVMPTWVLLDVQKRYLITLTVLPTSPLTFLK